VRHDLALLDAFAAAFARSARLEPGPGRCCVVLASTDPVVAH
jgi:hypothetical protein